MFSAVVNSVFLSPTNLTAKLTVTAEGFEPRELTVDATGKTPETFLAEVRGHLAALNANGPTAKQLSAWQNAGTVIAAS